ncbi:MAG: hypothetical protein KME26_05375 [Oscillatoria princeps RMCB-10]|jgi:uncharacterized protein with PIN domain|nr:hypothetical protein [Oscillatoria princeps RMCB-10]
MKFIVDAQLPVRLARFLQSAGYSTIHTNEESRVRSASSILAQLMVPTRTRNAPLEEGVRSALSISAHK